MYTIEKMKNASVNSKTTFTGKSGYYITITRNDIDDYEVWFHDDENSTETEGYSVRGSFLDIVEEIKNEL